MLIDILLVILAGVPLYFLGKWVIYKRAERNVVEWVRSYKRRCTESNRFLVSREILQNSFREYDSVTIDKAFNTLIDMRLIQQDPMDNEWCIR